MPVVLRCRRGILCVQRRCISQSFVIDTRHGHHIEADLEVQNGTRGTLSATLLSLATAQLVICR